MKKVIKEQVKKEVSKITPKIEKLVIEQLESEVLVRSSKEANTSHVVAANLSELELKKILIDKMEANNSINSQHSNCSSIKALVDARKVTTTTGSKLYKKSASQSAPVNETYAKLQIPFEAPAHQEFETGVHDEQVEEESVPVVHESVQPWLSNLAQRQDPRESFDELTDSTFDFSAFVMNRLNVQTLTPELLAVEWQNYKHLDWITVRRDDDVLYKFKEGDFHRLRIQDIEDMLLLLVQGKVTNLNVEERIAFNVSLRMFTRSVVIQRRVEDLQLGVESYQKKLNLTKPDTYRSNLRRQDAYTPYSDPRGFIYENKDKKNRLMRIDELHKFSDGTLDDVRTALNDRLKGIRMEYLPQTFWSQRDKANARAMIQAIDKRLKTRRIMRSLERFVGGRPYGGDLRLLQRTIMNFIHMFSHLKRVNSFTMKMEILLEPTSNKLMVEHAEYDESNTYVLERFNTSAGNPVKKILLKLNLSDHRLLKMVVEVPDSSYFRYSDTTHLSRSVEVLKLKKFQERCNIKAFQEWYEHVGPEVASPQDGKVTRWRRDCAWLMISRCSRSQCQIQVQGTSSIQEVNDHYNIFTRESQELLVFYTIPLAPKVKNNREAHEYYLKHTIEQAAILREVVEQAKSLNPLDSASYTTCKYVKLIQELLGYVRETCPVLHTHSKKLVAVMPIKKKKIVQFDNTVASTSTMPKVINTPLLSTSGSKPSGNTKNDRISRPPSSKEKNNIQVQSRKPKSHLNKKNSESKNVCNEHVKHSVVEAKALCSVCSECLFDANHTMCLIAYVNSMNVRAKSATKKNKQKEEWKPIGKVFNFVGYKWIPTRRTFTLVGTVCPLTRITTTNKVPLREPIPLKVVAQETIVTKVYTRRPKVPIPVQNSKTKIIKSLSANTKEPGTSRGSNASIAPSSPSLIDCSKFLCTVKFKYDQIAKIMRYSDYIVGNVMISRVYYVEGLGHNLFSVGQFCDSDLENMNASTPICLLSKATKTKSWLWHRRLSHLNFSAINHLARHCLVRGLPKLKYEKDHLCSACALGKSKKQSHTPKSKDSNQEKLYLLHMDLCGPMRVKSANGKRLNVPVRKIRTNNGTEFVNQTMREYYEEVGISHETSVVRTPQQNGVIERQNHTLVEAAQTMLIFAQAPLFLWAEVVATACYTQNRSLIRRRHGKTPYELLHDKKPYFSYLYVFGALCYPNNDIENLGKLQAKADIGIFIGYAPTKKPF
ncbi:retrovirus-related pol polyprotein from transposon TNT 1-94 [Tanacetum coccineum]